MVCREWTSKSLVADFRVADNGEESENTGAIRWIVQSVLDPNQLLFQYESGAVGSFDQRRGLLSKLSQFNTGYLFLFMVCFSYIILCVEALPMNSTHVNLSGLGVLLIILIFCAGQRW